MTNSLSFISIVCSHLFISKDMELSTEKIYIQLLVAKLLYKANVCPSVCLSVCQPRLGGNVIFSAPN